MKTPPGLGMLLLAIWFIASGALYFVTVAYSSLIMAIFAIIVGVLLLMKR